MRLHSIADTMAIGYTTIAVITALIAAVSFGIPWLLAEVFPVQSLLKQRNGRPTVTTKSYKGRTALITGANGAFGSRAAKLFAERDVETLVLVDVRDCTAVKEQIEAEAAANGRAKPNILLWQIDMMTFAGCQVLAKKAKELKNLDHVLLTAGILSFDRRESPEGWETSIQVNFLSNALIALTLLPLLRSSAGNPNPPVLTFVTTFSVYPASPTMGMPRTGSYLKRLSNNKPGLAQGHQYGRSKALLLYFTRELAARVSAAEKQGRMKGKATVNSADPGSSWTGLTNPNQAMLIPRLIMNISARDPVIGATALVNGASSSASGHGQIMADFDMDP